MDVFSSETWPQLRYLAVTYFHQDYDLDAPAPLDVVRLYAGGRPASAVAELESELRRLLSLPMDDAQLRAIWIDEWGASYDPQTDRIGGREWFGAILSVLLAERLLRVAGWSPGRSVDVSSPRAMLEERGYAVGPLTEAFLREFDGLTVDYVRNGHADSVWFDAGRASVEADAEWVAEYGRRLGESLVPIGFSNHDHLLVMIAGSGSFYGGFDNFLCQLGPSAPAMIDNIVSQESRPLTGIG